MLISMVYLENVLNSQRGYLYTSASRLTKYLVIAASVLAVCGIAASSIALGTLTVLAKGADLVTGDTSFQLAKQIVTVIHNTVSAMVVLDVYHRKIKLI
jgi:hypothetical protein